MDAELSRLLLEELRRHESALASHESDATKRRALHALKGSAGLAGERELSESLAHAERRHEAGDASATEEARVLVAEAIRDLEAGKPIAVSVWPAPPPHLVPARLDVATSGHYAAEMQDRLARLDQALASKDDDAAAVLSLFRDVHAMKGAALAVADEVTAWFCHGLEERLRGAERSDEATGRALAEMTRWRGILSELIVAPARALDTLRMIARSGRRPSFPPPLGGPLPPPPRRPTQEPTADPDLRSSPPDDSTLRIPMATLDRLFERLCEVAEEHDAIEGAGAILHSVVDELQGLRFELAESLRQIGPARPWGPPDVALRRIDAVGIKLSGIGDRLDGEAQHLKETADRVTSESAAAHRDLSAVRTTRIGSLFERVAAAVSAQARREGREVRVRVSGEDSGIERHVADQLFDPVIQLAKNAVTHGIESAAERALRGKPRIGTVHMSAQARSGGLRLMVQDDGAGVDIPGVRSRAVAKGTISAERAEAADDETLLSLLFVPGFTTRDSADLLAGRGVGLDLALEAVHRLGGSLRLTTEQGSGLTATLDIPFQPGLLMVLWVRAGDATYAFPVQNLRGVRPGRDVDARCVVMLSDCLRAGGRATSNALRSAPRRVIELLPNSDLGALPMIGVDTVGTIEEVSLRSVPSLVATAGPYAGAVVRSGELRLCLDVDGLAEVLDRTSE